MERRVPGQPFERVIWPAESLARAAEAIGNKMDGAAVHDTVLLAKAALYAAAPSIKNLHELMDINRVHLQHGKQNIRPVPADARSGVEAAGTLAASPTQEQ